MKIGKLNINIWKRGIEIFLDEEEISGWYEQEELLRTAHSYIKNAMNIQPFWFSDRRNLPKRYIKKLEWIDDKLYEAEEYACKKLIVEKTKDGE